MVRTAIIWMPLTANRTSLKRTWVPANTSSSWRRSLQLVGTLSQTAADEIGIDERGRRRTARCWHCERERDRGIVAPRCRAERFACRRRGRWSSRDPGTPNRGTRPRTRLVPSGRADESVKPARPDESIGIAASFGQRVIRQDANEAVGIDQFDRRCRGSSRCDRYRARPGCPLRR